MDVERRELRLGDTKAGRVHYVPLNEAALTILRGLERVDGNPYVLPGHKTGQHLVNISKPWQRVRKAAGKRPMAEIVELTGRKGKRTR